MKRARVRLMQVVGKGRILARSSKRNSMGSFI